LTKYYRTHDEDLSGQVIRNWKNDPSQHGSRHGSIATDVKKWPDIPPVFAKLGEEIQNLYPESFQTEYFLGQIHISKMESRPPKDLPSNNKTHHNSYSGNKLRAHVDHAREGDAIITVLLAEPIILRLIDGSKAVDEKILHPGSAYCLRCPEGYSYDVIKQNISCQSNCCPRHGLKHEIECAHPPTCSLYHEHLDDSATRKLPTRTGPRFALVYRYFRRLT